LGRTDFDVWPPEVAEALRQNDRQVLSSGKTLETIEPVLAANGDLQYAAVTKFPFTDSSGRLYLGGMAINITQWKHAEAALRQSEERHRALVAAIPDLIFRLDRHGRFLDYEPGRGLEADPRDFLGKTVDELFDSELAGRTRLVIERALHDGEIHTFESPLPLNGGQREWEARLVADGNGEVLAVVRDVSARKRAEDILRRQAEELAALQDTVLDLTATHDLNMLLQTIVERAVGLLKATGGALFLYDAERHEARCVVSYNTSDAYVGMVKKLGEAPSGAIVAAGRGLIADAHVVWAGRHSLQLAPTSVASTPMTWQGRVTGVIDVLDNRPSRRFAPADLELLTLFANHAAIAVENTRLYESERQARKLAETLRAANVALTRSLDLEVVLETLLDCLAELVPYDSANVMLLEPGGRLVIRALRGYECWSDPDAIRAVTLARDTPIIETLLNRTEGIVIADTLAEPGWDPIPDSVHVRTWMGVPVIAGGRVIGLYSLDKTVPGFFTDEHRRLVEALAAQAAVAIQNAQLFEHVRRSQAWLQRVTQRVVSAEEEERHRIARELHDDVLNEMAVLAMDQEWRTIPARLQERYHALTLRTRQITAALRPPMLAKGLDGALEDLVAEFDQRVGGQPRVRLYVFDREVRYPPHVEAHLFRIVQQAAENALRHGHPRTIAIYAHLGASRVRITVEDDGMGFDTGAGLDLADLVTSKHLGLASMYERAVLIGATVHIDSVPGAGTRVQVRWDAGGSAEA
ncbi:MAG TPA: GAF domain-containing protein, partial [Ardenticatenaceae bacterium]|nr:GAF domain-containing protein [Ardenticatenaceae bacterium]